MELKYDIYKLRNSQGTGEERSYVRIVQHEPMSENDLRERIQDRCSLTKGDVAAVLAELHDIAVEEMSNGRRFYIPELGYFSLSASLEVPKERSDKKITGKEVRIAGINFRPESKLMQEIRRGVSFVRSKRSCQSATYTGDQLFAKIQDYLKDNRYITARIMRFQFGLTQYATQKWLKFFCEKGMLVKEGTPRLPIYFLRQ